MQIIHFKSRIFQDKAKKMIIRKYVYTQLIRNKDGNA